MKQKLALACTLIHTPEVIFLDEPTTGVDPVTRRDFWKLLAELLRDGTTIFLTTPYLDEAERCTRVALMSNGEILACDHPAAIRSMLGQQVVQVVCSPTRKARTLALNNDEMRSFFDDVQAFGDRLDFIYHDRSTREAIELIERVFADFGIVITTIRPKATTIENVFMALLGKQSSDAEKPVEEAS